MAYIARRINCRHGILAMPVVFLLIAVAPASPAPIDGWAELGLGGWIVPGAWTPLRVEITTRAPLDGDLVVAASKDPRSTGGAEWHHPLRLGPAARHRLDLSVIIDDPRQPLRLSVRSGSRLLMQREIPVGAARTVEGVVVGLTDDPAGLELVADFPRKLRPAYLHERHLPVRWQDYESVELLVIRDLDPGRILPAQREALVQWVAQGGRLLVTGGERFALLQVSWLLDLLPALPTGGTRSVRLPMITGSANPVLVAAIRPRPAAEVTQEARAAVAARWRYGRGIVTVWAFDPFTSTARAWPKRRAVWATVLNSRLQPPAATVELGRVLPTSQSLPGRAQAGVAVVIVLYILAVRYVQQRLVPRRAGWLSLATVTVIFVVLMHAFAVTTRGSTIAATQLSIVEIMPGLPWARAATYVSIVNPYGGTYRLEAPAGAALRSLDRIPVAYEDSRVLLASVAGRGLIFESLQMLPLAVAARIIETGGAPAIVVNSGPAVRIIDPVLFLRGRLYRLPDIGGHLALDLDPAKWEGAEARGPIPQELRAQIRHAAYTRLRETDGLRDHPWLLGWIDDPRTHVKLAQGQTESVQLLVVEAMTGR